MNSAAAATLFPVPVVIMVCGVIGALLCVPLIRGKVRRNLVYGIRTRLAFSSEENWYRVNRIGGLIFFRASLFMAVTGFVGLRVPARYEVFYCLAAAGLSLAAILLAAIRVLMIKPQPPS